MSFNLSVFFGYFGNLSFYKGYCRNLTTASDLVSGIDDVHIERGD